MLSPEVNFAEITAAGGFQVTTSGVLSIQSTGTGTTFGLPAAYGVGVEEGGDLEFASHKYVDDSIKIEHDARIEEEKRLDARIDGKAASSDVYTKTYIDDTYWTRTESNSKYYSALNPN